MALTVKKVSGKGQDSSASILKKWQKTKGDSIGSYGGYFPSPDRVPTGVFDLDLALGGGFPRGKCSIVYGPESSNKTNLVLLAIAMHQKIWPDKTCVFVDVENAFDPTWAKRLGVDTDKLIVVVPGYAEQVVDIVEDFVNSSDLGILAIDSIAAMMTTAQGENSAERVQVGGATIAMTSLAQKTTKCMGDAEKDGRFPTLIYINQTRTKIGVMFGDPETMPGGQAIRFQASLWVRVSGKNITDATVSAAMPVRKLVSFIVKKWKFPILKVSGKFEMAMLPHNGYSIGDCADFGSIKTYLQTFSLFEKDEAAKKGWLIDGVHYDKQEEFSEKLRMDKLFGNGIRQKIIQKMLAHGSLLEDGELPDDGA